VPEQVRAGLAVGPAGLHHGVVTLSYASIPAPGRHNEDLVVVGPSFALVLDGATQPPGLATGCQHDPRWLVRTLGAILADLLRSRAAAPLACVLATAIGRLCETHRGSCDLTNPESPSTTVAIVRRRTTVLDYLVLCDSTVVLQYDERCVAVTDDRTARLPAYDRATVARLRNAPGGFWVASTAPDAAHHALTGTVHAESLRAVLVCTDGVSRLVELFGRSWAEVADCAERHGPAAVIRSVREAERANPPQPRRRKLHDDASLLRWAVRPEPARTVIGCRHANRPG
jgi:hypothetical protein